MKRYRRPNGPHEAPLYTESDLKKICPPDGRHFKKREVVTILDPATSEAFNQVHLAFQRLPERSDFAQASTKKRWAMIKATHQKRMRILKAIWNPEPDE